MSISVNVSTIRHWCGKQQSGAYFLQFMQVGMKKFGTGIMILESEGRSHSRTEDSRVEGRLRFGQLRSVNLNFKLKSRFTTGNYVEISPKYIKYVSAVHTLKDLNQYLL